MIGRTLAHYEITAAIGKGGMGEVYRATDNKLGRNVAIKVLPEEFASDAERVARFEREAKLLASLNHPNIAAIYGLEESEGTRFLVLELVEGQTLSDRLVRGPLPVQESLELALQITEALEAAHEKGVIHRDLKPANIKVTSEGKIKVLDFGLAKAYAGTTVGNETVLETLAEDAESGKGVLLGTPAYMSPEQARRQPADHRSDVWAFGCVLYELLTGKTLFKGNTLSDTIASILEREPDGDDLPQNLSPTVRRLLERCLEKNPKRRWQAIGDVRLEIEGALTEDVFVPAVLPDNPRARSLPYVVAILGVLMAIPLGWYLRTVLRPEPRAVTRFEYELPPIERFEGGLSLAISPNGRQVVSGSSDGLFVRSMDEIETRHISGTEGELISAPFFSPDAQWVGYWSPNEGLLKKVAIGGGTPIVLTGAEQPYGPFWTSDDSILYVQTNQGNNSAIVSVSANGGIPEILFEREGSIFNPIVLPDTRSVLFAIGPAYDARVVARSLESGDEKVLFSGGGVFYFVTTGHLVYQLENDVVARRFDPETWEAGPPVVLLQNVLRGGVAGPLYFDVSESGSLIYAQGIQPGLGTPVWVTRDGHEDEALADSPLTRPQHPRLSPDASRFAMSELGDIWVYDVAGRPPMKVTFDGSNLSPLWTPDGQRIVYEGASGYGSGSPSSLWAVSADGSSAVPERVSPEGHFHPHGWSGDGLELLADFAEGANGIDIVRWQIAEPDDFESVVATPADEGRWGATLSPDGRWLAYDSNLTGHPEIWVRPYPGPGAPVRVSPNGGIEPVWARDGRELYYLEGNSVMAVAVDSKDTFDFQPPERLFERIFLRRRQAPSYDVGADGRFLMIRNDSVTTRRMVVVQNWIEEVKERVPVP